jgi:hypothetical protein
MAALLNCGAGSGGCSSAARDSHGERAHLPAERSLTCLIQRMELLLYASRDLITVRLLLALLRGLLGPRLPLARWHGCCFGSQP